MAEKKQMYRVVNPNQDKKFDEKMRLENPERRQYLICISAQAGSGENDLWQLVTGRTEAYNLIKENIDYIDFFNSFILVETCKLVDRQSIYTFMKHVEKFYEEDSFDIDDYVRGDWSEDEYLKYNEIDRSLLVDSSTKLNMQDIMNGTVEID